jgi:PAS domain S-box-containing protein
MFPMSESEGVARADAGHAAGTDAASLAAQLREEGARLIAAQAVAKVGSWETDLTTMAVRWSDETFRIFELTPAAFSPTHPGFLEQVHPDDRAAVEQAFTASLDGGMPCAIEHRVSLPDGRVKYVEERWQVFRDDAGRPVRAIGTCQDVSAWKDAMLRLEQSQSLLRIAGRLARLGGWSIDWPGGALQWSDDVCAIHDVPAGTAPTLEQAFGFYPPEYRAAVVSTFERCGADGTPFEFERPIVSARGRTVWIRVVGEAERDAEGRIIRLHGAVQDVTERHEATAQITRLNDQLVNTLESITDAFITLDRERRFTYVNAEAVRLLRRSREELIGAPVGIAFSDETIADFRRHYEKARARGAPVAFEAFHPGLDMWLDVRAFPTADGLTVYFRDVTTLHDNRETLRASEERFQFLAKAANEAIWDWDIVRGTLWWNEGCRTLFGAQVATDPSYGAWEARVHPEDRARVMHGLHETLAGASDVWHDEYRFRRTDGTYVFVSDRGYVIRDDRARPVRMVGAMTDLTERHRARAEQQQMHEAVLKVARGVSAPIGPAFFEHLIESMIDALGADAGCVARVNPDLDTATTVCLIAGGRRLGDLDIDLRIPPFDRIDTSEPCMLTPETTPAGVGPMLFRETGADTGVAARLGDASGTPIGLLLVLFRRAPERREFIASMLKIFAARAASELERLRSDLRLREQAALLDKAQDAIVLRDLDERVVYWNRSAEVLYGWTAAEMTGRSVERLYKDPSVLRAAVRAVHAKGEWHGEVEQVTRHGESRTVEARWTLVRDDAGRPTSILAINTDITERRQLEQQYLRAQRLESIGTLAGGIAHDLNNVLAPIVMSVGLLQRDERDPDRLELLETIETSAVRAGELVRQVLSFARGMGGDRVPVDAGAVVGDLTRLLRDTFPKGIQIVDRLDPELRIIEADPTQLHQVLLNLCLNARDAMPAGGRLTIEASNQDLDEPFAAAHVEATAGPYLRLVVEDTGQGIAPAIIEKIFDPFFTTKEVGKGTGLGLATSLAIVKGHGGFFHVQSTPGRGARFEIYLPAADIGPAEVAPDRNQDAIARGRGELVLVVDDEASIREVTRRTLEAFGYRVLLAADGSEAVSLYAQRQADIALVVTDMMMPVMDGAVTIQILHRLNPDVRIVGMSGLEGRFVTDAVRARLHGLLAKPYTAQALVSAVRRAIAS